MLQDGLEVFKNNQCSAVTQHFTDTSPPDSVHSGTPSLLDWPLLDYQNYINVDQK